MSAPVLDITAQDRDFLNAMNRVELDLLRSQTSQTTELRDAADRTAYANESRNYRLQDQIMMAIHQGNQELLAATERNGALNLSATDRNGTMNLSATDRNGTANLLATERVGGLNQSAIERIGAVNLAATERIGGGLSSQAERISGQQFAAQERIANFSNAQAERIGSGIMAETARISRDLANISAVGQLDNLRGFANLQKQASDQYASIQIEALKNKDALALQMATQGADLKDAIRSSEIDRLRDDLQKSQTEALFNSHRFHCHDHHRHHDHHGPHHIHYPYPFPFFGPGPFFGGGAPFGAAQGQGQGR